MTAGEKRGGHAREARVFSAAGLAKLADIKIRGFCVECGCRTAVLLASDTHQATRVYLCTMAEPGDL